MIGRRSFITGLVSLVAAPAIVRAGSLMPVKVMPSMADIERIMLDHAYRCVNPPLIGATPYGVGDLIKYRDGFLIVVRTSILDDLR